MRPTKEDLSVSQVRRLINCNERFLNATTTKKNSITVKRALLCHESSLLTPNESNF